MLPATPSATPVSTGYIDRAYKALAALNILPSKSAEAPAVMAIVTDVSVVDEGRALLIGRTLQAEAEFNALVRDEIKGTEVGSSYEKIAAAFDSIITDAKSMLAQANSGHAPSFRDKASNTFMKLTRGSIHDRFMRIKRQFEDVSKRTSDALVREKAILAAYLEYRGSLKEAEGAAYAMLSIQEKILATAQADLQARVAAVTAAAEGEAKAKAQLARDESKTLLDDAQRRYDRLKKIADNLKVAYNVGEAVIARLSQGHAVKEGVYDQAVTFFSTNESSFTALDATLTQMAGLHEISQATRALERGSERAIEAVAEVGTVVQEEALRTSHGATIKAESVKKLMDAIVDFQTKAAQIAAEERKNATDNANLMEKYVDDGKKRFAELVSAGPAS
jgi:hypothetical protein